MGNRAVTTPTNNNTFKSNWFSPTGGPVAYRNDALSPFGPGAATTSNSVHASLHQERIGNNYMIKLFVNILK